MYHAVDEICNLKSKIIAWIIALGKNKKKNSLNKKLNKIETKINLRLKLRSVETLCVHV